jgi:hypothetical protein
MTDGQTLYAVFAAFYLIECLRLVHARAWLAAGEKELRWRWRRGIGNLVVSGGSPVLLSALPPLRAHVQTLPWLFSPRTDGLAIQTSDGSLGLLPWDEVKPQTDGALLKPGRQIALRLPSEESAAFWKTTLEHWCELTPEKRRAAFLKHARASLDTDDAKKTAETASERTVALRVCGEMIFMWTFMVFPALYYWYGEHRITFTALAMLPVMTVTQAFFFLRAVKKHRLPVKHRWWRALALATLPHQSIRAADIVSLLPAHLPHPLALRGLVKEEDLLEVAREMWRAARYQPGWSSTETLTPEAEALERFFKEQKLAPDDYDPAPQLAPEVIAWCPRCHAPFLKADAPCRDCGGVELKKK